MANYIPEESSLNIISRTGNIVFMADGNIWCNYILAGSLVDMYSPVSIDGIRSSHAILFSSLMKLGTDEIIISGFKSPVATTARLNRSVKGVKEFSASNYPELNETLRTYASGIESGMLKEYRRVYLISARVPATITGFEKLKAQITGSNPFKGRSDLRGEIEEFNTKLFEAIPPIFKPAPAPADVLEWFRQRHCLRGVKDPDPFTMSPTAATPPNAGFPAIRLNPNPDGESILADAVKRIVGKSKDKKAVSKAEESIGSYFRSLQQGRMLAVHNYDTRITDMPDGAISYQAVMAISRYATAADYSLNTLTSAVDAMNNLDGDFTMRLFAAPELDNNDEINATLSKIEAENQANSKSIFDTEIYADRARELLDFTNARKDELAPVIMKVCTIFSFGAPRLDVLNEKVRSVEKRFSDDGYKTFRPMGGQEELWLSMLPCVPSTTMIKELSGTTTAVKLGAYAPIRRVGVGDGVGFPFGMCLENNLGSEVHIDLVEATIRGNGSIAFTGAQGKGKSYAMKRIVAAMSDLRYMSVILDGQGEWGTYVTQLPSHQVIDLAHPTYSIDPLKILGRGEGLSDACDMLQKLLLPMFGVKPKTAAHSALVARMNPEYLRSRESIVTTRDLLEHLVVNASVSVEYKEAVPVIKDMLADPSMSAFVDPVVNGRVQYLPPVQIKARTVAFVTYGLSLPSPDTKPAEYTSAESYAVMANTAVAIFSQWLFRTVGKKVSCAFVADETWFLEDLPILSQLIKEPDRTGRKFSSFVVVGSQTGSELSKPEYKLIRRRVCMGQDTLDNAREALQWAGFADSRGNVPEELVIQLATNTSPLDPDNENRPRAGREGEAFYNDGTRKAKIKIYPELQRNRARFADTRSDRWIRYDSKNGK